jgi:hypothetical protein
MIPARLPARIFSSLERSCLIQSDHEPSTDLRPRAHLQTVSFARCGRGNGRGGNGGFPEERSAGHRTGRKRDGMFDHIKIGTFVLRIKALNNLGLPAYKGSTLRGGFGQALKEVACALRRQECGNCLLRDRCVYSYVFETPPPADAEMMKLYPAAPHPFVIEPPESESAVVPAGENLEFGLILVGRALEYLPYFIYAFMRLGERGLGRGRGKFALDGVLASGANGPIPIYREEKKSLRSSSPYPTWDSVKERVGELSGSETLTLHFLTPTRVKYEERLVAEPEFHHFVRSLLRRLSSLSSFHCGRRLDLDFKGLVERAGKIARVSSDLRWYDWERYSSRQKQRMTLGGFIGRVTYAGDFKEFLPLLAWGEVLHVGKAASFGLGRYEIDAGRF